ncbi:MAG TPA: type II toxin-antitoxin system VapC family toxin [Syntrophomonadaceae bacterium]|nr:type II toxin-antitoxin system VapC family toxin [Syntrophomonadaceae bacterium]
MIAKYLVDTDWAVYYLRGKEPFVTKLQEYLPHGLGLSIITVAELYEGIFRSTRPDDSILAAHQVL